MCHIFFIHSSVDGHLGCFHVLAIVNKAAMNIVVHVSFWIMVFSGYMPSSGIAGSYGSSIFSFFFFFNIYLFIWLHRVLFIFLFIFGCVGSSFLCEGFLQLRQVGATLHRGARASSPSRPLPLRSTGSRRAGSVAVAHGLSCSAARGILPDQGSNPCPPH